MDLVLDGGNIVKCDDKIIMTKKVFAENKDKKQKDIIRMLEEAFQCDIIFLPWDEEEIFGHSDGIVHFVGNNQVLMTNYADIDPYFARRFMNNLKKSVEVIPLTFNGQTETQTQLGVYQLFAGGKFSSCATVRNSRRRTSFGTNNKGITALQSVWRSCVGSRSERRRVELYFVECKHR